MPVAWVKVATAAGQARGAPSLRAAPGPLGSDGGEGGEGGDGGAGAGGGGGGADGGGGGGGEGGAAAWQPLGMNDVTILVPLPQAGAPPVLLGGTDVAQDGTALVPRALFDRLVKDAATGMPLPTLDSAYERLQVVAVRFDLCDRHLPGSCSDTEDALMRLVLQPILLQGSADDVGFHAFYAIRKDELAAALGALRQLASLAPAQGGALRVSPALGGTARDAYAAKAREFVERYGGDTRLVRLTMNAQNRNFAALVWALRGVEKQGDGFADIPIAGSTEVSESVTLVGSSGFEASPVADTPTGLLGAINQITFDKADPATKLSYLTALVAVDNPLTNTAETAPCVGCHVATFVMNARATSSGIDPLALAGRYTSKFELSTAGGESATMSRTNSSRWGIRAHRR